jgi:leucyl aminopeptidase
MTVPTLRVLPSSAIPIIADALVIGVRRTDDGPAALGELDGIPSTEVLAAIGVTGAKDELRRLPGGGARSIALIGLGSDEPTASSLRYAAGSAARQLTGVGSIVLALPTTDETELLAVLEGAAIGAYDYTEYRSSTDPSRLHATEITIVSDVAESAQLIERAVALAEAMHRTKDLVNMPPSDLYPESFAAAVTDFAQDLPLEVTVLAEAELSDGGYGGVLGVGQGSARGPRLVKIAYSPAGAGKHLALVGKGITFDTGGLSLKPGASMVGMKYDMTGAATVMAVVLAAARLALPVRLTAWLCIAENMPSGSALRPNDVLRIRGGKTVEVLNTDAEGRLVLADGLAAASEEQPDAIVDVATLTGAARVALGDRYSAAMGDRQFVDRLVDLARATDELLWPMPLPEELLAAIRSDVADLANARIGNTAGGMLLAGVFLREFVGAREGEDSVKIPWAHLDIAGTANNPGGGYGFTGKGPTGVTVRLLLRLAEEFSRP